VVIRHQDVGDRTLRRLADKSPGSVAGRMAVELIARRGDARYQQWKRSWWEAEKLRDKEDSAARKAYMEHPQ
jgi:hypothetical protein